jgi:tetratricopeptide (TPR) repeat protein
MTTLTRAPQIATQHAARTALRAALAAALVLSALSLPACHSSGSRETLDRDINRAREQEIAAKRDANEFLREGERLEKLGKTDQALDYYKRAVTTYRDTPGAWNNLGRLFMKQNQNQEAAEAFRIAADISPADPRPVHNLGTLWESIGYPADASRYYSEALSRDADYLPSLRRSVRLDVNLARVTDLTEARLRRALYLETDPKWRELLMRAQVRLHDGSMPEPTQSTSTPVVPGEAFR